MRERSGANAVFLAPNEIPMRLPDVVTRMGLEVAPLDPFCDDDMAWLEALIWPEQPYRLSRFRQALAIQRRCSPTILRSTAEKDTFQLCDSLPAATAVCVFHSFLLHQLPLAARRCFTNEIVELSRRRPVFRISLEWRGRRPVLALEMWCRGERTVARLLASCHAHGLELHVANSDRRRNCES